MYEGIFLCFVESNRSSWEYSSFKNKCILLPIFSFSSGIIKTIAKTIDVSIFRFINRRNCSLAFVFLEPLLWSRAWKEGEVRKEKRKDALVASWRRAQRRNVEG